MKVKDLIKELKNYNEDLDVVIITTDGYGEAFNNDCDEVRFWHDRIELLSEDISDEYDEILDNEEEDE